MRIFREILPNTIVEFKSIKDCLIFTIGQVIGGVLVLVLLWYLL
jgi:hypothetical protein